MVARVWEDQHEWIPHPNSFSSPINLAGRAATAAAEAGPQHCGSQGRDRAQKMQLPGSKVGCVVRKMKLEGVCMLSVELGISYGDWRERGGDKEIRQETLSYCVSMGSGCVCCRSRQSVKERSSAVRREAQQEGLQRNLSAATGRIQLQNAMRTYLPGSLSRQKCSRRPKRAAWVTLHGTDRDRQGEAAAQSTALHQWWQQVPTLSTQKNNRASRDGLREKSDFALCLSTQLHKRGCVSSQHPMITQLSMTHRGARGGFPLMILRT